jgi:hypothetical protein
MSSHKAFLQQRESIVEGIDVDIVHVCMELSDVELPGEENLLAEGVAIPAAEELLFILGELCASIVPDQILCSHSFHLLNVHPVLHKAVGEPDAEFVDDVTDQEQEFAFVDLSVYRSPHERLVCQLEVAERQELLSEHLLIESRLDLRPKLF